MKRNLNEFYLVNNLNKESSISQSTKEEITEENLEEMIPYDPPDTEFMESMRNWSKKIREEYKA